MDMQRASEESAMSRWPIGAGDHAASMSVIGGIGLALHHRHTTGEGQLVDVSLLRAGIWANSHSVVAATASEEWSESMRLEMPAGGRPLLSQPATASDTWIHLLGYETHRHTGRWRLGLGDPRHRQGRPTGPSAAVLPEPDYALVPA